MIRIIKHEVVKKDDDHYFVKSQIGDDVLAICNTAKEAQLILDRLEGKNGYEFPLPDSIQWALNSGDGVYRP